MKDEEEALQHAAEDERSTQGDLCAAFHEIRPLGLAVGISLFLMYITRTVHPPGGSTALIGVMGGAGFMFVLVPVLAGALILLLVALFTNNVVHHWQYPKNWI